MSDARRAGARTGGRPDVRVGGLVLKHEKISCTNPKELRDYFRKPGLTKHRCASCSLLSEHQQAAPGAIGGGRAPRVARIQGRGPPGPRAPASRPNKKGPSRAPGAKMPLVGQRRPALPRTYSAVPSALGGLTSGFGMGPGVPPLPWPLTNKGHSSVRGRVAVPSGPHSVTTSGKKVAPTQSRLPIGVREKSSAY